jgi:hypothetical protein
MSEFIKAILIMMIMLGTASFLLVTIVMTADGFPLCMGVVTLTIIAVAVGAALPHGKRIDGGGVGSQDIYGDADQ